jgi:hypothetical protein
MSTGQSGRGASAIPAPHLLQLFLVLAVCAAAGLTPPAGGTAAAQQSSWIFSRGTYTHDPCTGARVAQYAPIPPVEALDDQRLVTSRYRYSRTNLRGSDGSLDTYYEVQTWGNGLGGLDAEWERFHDAWKESYISGGYYERPYTHRRPYGPWFYGGFPAYPGFTRSAPAYGWPGYGDGGTQW